MSEWHEPDTSPETMQLVAACASKCKMPVILWDPYHGKWDVWEYVVDFEWVHPKFPIAAN